MDTVNPNVLGNVNNPSKALEAAVDFCLTCPVVGEYGDLANGYLGKLSVILQSGMENIFMVAFPLWFIFGILQVAIGTSSINKLAQDFIYAIIAFIMLKSYGAEIVTGLYKLSLDIIGATAQLTFLEGNVASYARAH